MTKWLVVYRKQGETQWYKFCYANTQGAVSTAMTRLFEKVKNIEVVQIKKVVV